MSATNALEAGDRVVISVGSTGGRPFRYFGTVERLTKTQVVVRYGEHTTNYRRDDVAKVGGGVYNTDRIEVCTPQLFDEVKDEIVRRKMIKHLQAMQWHTLTTDDLSHLYEFSRSRPGAR